MSKTRDPDVHDLPKMVTYLRTGILAGYHGYISKTHLEDLISLDHPPGFYVERSVSGRRRLVTKAMNRMNFETWSGRAWLVL